jgi:hypothetical protein
MLRTKRALFVKPGTVRLDLEGDLDGYWIEIKKALTFRERETLNGAVLTSMPVGGTGSAGSQYGIDVARYNLLRLQTYLVDWNFEDDKGKQLDCRRQNIENLDPDVADAVTARLDEYLTARQQGGKASGNGTTSEGPPSSSSRPAGAGGS